MRPLNSRYFGHPDLPGKQLILDFVWLSDSTEPETGYWIVKQVGTGRYRVTNGEKTGIVHIVDGEPTGPGQGNIRIQPYGETDLKYARVIHSNVLKTWDLKRYRWTTNEATERGQATLPFDDIIYTDEFALDDINNSSTSQDIIDAIDAHPTKYLATGSIAHMYDSLDSNGLENVGSAILEWQNLAGPFDSMSTLRETITLNITTVYNQQMFLSDINGAGTNSLIRSIFINSLGTIVDDHQNIIVSLRNTGKQDAIDYADTLENGSYNVVLSEFRTLLSELGTSEYAPIITARNSLPSSKFLNFGQLLPTLQDIIDAHNKVDPKPGDENGLGSNITINLDEAELANGNHVVNQNMFFTAGTDPISDYGFGGSTGITVDGLNGTLIWSIVSGDLIATLNGDTVITLSISGTTIPADESGSIIVTGELSNALPHEATHAVVSISGITVVATDSANATATGTVSVNVADDVPEIAINGATSAVEGGAAINGTWTSSTYDVAGEVIEVTVGSDTETLTGNDDVSFSTAAGSLTVASNNTWSFTPGTDIDHSGGNVSVQFTMTKTDGDGDVASANHTISVSDGSGPVSNNSATFNLDEASIPHSLNDDLSFTAGSDTITTFTFGPVGNINVTGLDGTLSWDVVGSTLVGALDGTDAITVALNNIQSIAPGATGTVNVSAELELALPHVDSSVSITGITVIASENDGDSASANVAVTVADGTPTINISGPTSVIAGTEAINGAWSSTDGVDTPTTITATVGGNTQPLVNSVNFNEAAGDLVISDSGSWSFTPSTNAGSIEFSLTITDSDNDTMTDNHTITVTPSQGPEVAGNPTFNFSDATAGNGGQELNDTIEFTAGTFAINSIAFGPTGSINVVGLDGTMSWNVDGDTLTGIANGTTLTVALSNTGTVNPGTSGNITVTATLSDALPHATSADITITGITVVATDSASATATGTVSVNVADDVPEIAINGPTSAVEGSSAINGTWTSSTYDVAGEVIEVTVGSETETLTGNDDVSFATVAGNLTVASDNTWSFTPGTDIDHSGGNVSIQFTMTKTDGDGDVASDNHTISVSDGSGPVSNNSIILSFDESFEVPQLLNSDLSFTAGSDSITSFAFGPVGNITVAGLDGTLSWDIVGTTLVGTLNGDDAITVALNNLATIAPGETGTIEVSAEREMALPHVDSQITINGITVIASEDDGDFVSTNVEITVDDTVPEIAITGDSQATEGGGAINGTWTSDAGADSVGAVINVTVDGSTQQLVGSPVTFNTTLGDFTLNLDNTWVFTPGTNIDHSGGNPSIAIEVEITDGDGNVASDSHTITVIDGADPEITITGDSQATEGGDVINGTWSSTDGTDTPTTVSVTVGGSTQTLTGETSVTFNETDGDLVVNDDGTWNFTPGTGMDFSGGDIEFSFTMEIADADGSNDTANHALTITQAEPDPEE